MLLSDVCLNITDGVHNTVSDTQSGGYFLLSCKNIKNGNIVLSDDEREIDKATFEKLRKRTKLEINDILITTVGTIGELCLIKSNPSNIEFQRSVGIIKPNTDIIDPYFLLYSLKKEINQIKTLVKGAVQQCLFIGDIKRINIDVPSLTTQKKMVSILKDIDLKINNNNRLVNDFNLQIKNIFEHNFCIPQDKIPLGWNVKKLGEVTTNKKERNTNKNNIVLSALNSGTLVPSAEHFTKQVFSKDTSKYIVVEKDDFAYNPARINIGSIGRNNLGYSGCVSPVYVVFSVEKYYEDFFEMYIKSYNFKEECSLRASGSVRQSLNYKDFSMIKIVYPSVEAVKRFNADIKCFKDAKISLFKENERLNELLDLLVNKVFSGEINYSKVE